jgi:hypothetical protein
MARMSTFLDQLTNYVKFEIEVLAANRKKEAERIRQERKKKREDVKKVLEDAMAQFKMQLEN